MFCFFFNGKKNYVLNHIGGNQENLFCDVLFPGGIFFFSSMCATELKVLEGIKKKFVGLCSKNNSNHYFIFSHLVPQKKKSKSFHKKITQ